MLVRMLAHLIERAVVNGERAVCLAQETACGTHILHNEMAQLDHHVAVIRRQHLVDGCIAQGYRYQV